MSFFTRVISYTAGYSMKGSPSKIAVKRAIISLSKSQDSFDLYDIHYQILIGEIPTSMSVSTCWKVLQALVKDGCLVRRKYGRSVLYSIKEKDSK